MNTKPLAHRITCILVLLLVGWAVPATAQDQSQTETELTQFIVDSFAYLNENLTERADYSTHGALEFWSSGGLLQEISPSDQPDQYEAVSLHPKHIRVISLVEGQAAVAHYYTEGSLTPEGAAPVGHYLTRVTQTFVKEDGTWKIRSSHYSAITGGAGTSQTVVEN